MARRSRGPDSGRVTRPRTRSPARRPAAGSSAALCGWCGARRSMVGLQHRHARRDTAADMSEPAEVAIYSQRTAVDRQYSDAAYGLAEDGPCFGWRLQFHDVRSREDAAVTV